MLQVAKSCNVLFVAVKPNVVRDVLNEVKDDLSPDTLIVSIAAGVTISTMQVQHLSLVKDRNLSNMLTP